MEGLADRETSRGLADRDSRYLYSKLYEFYHTLQLDLCLNVELIKGSPVTIASILLFILIGWPYRKTTNFKAFNRLSLRND